MTEVRAGAHQSTASAAAPIELHTTPWRSMTARLSGGFCSWWWWWWWCCSLSLGCTWCRPAQGWWWWWCRGRRRTAARRAAGVRQTACSGPPTARTWGSPTLRQTSTFWRRICEYKWVQMGLFNWISLFQMAGLCLRICRIFLDAYLLCFIRALWKG